MRADTAPQTTPDPGRRRLSLLGLAGFFLLAVGHAAPAQILLPGAAPAAAPPADGSAPLAPKPKPKPAPPKSISDQSIDGQTFYLNGTRGRLTVERRDKEKLILKFIAVGDKISKPAESCGVDLGAGHSLDLLARGRPEGVTRYEMGMPGCPLSVDVLDRAVFVSGISQACEFQEADCKVDPRGFWGPSATTLDSEIGGIEKDRARADKAVREGYKTLIQRVPKGDKAGVRKVASEQAGFTSERETVCRDYTREHVHGFCAARFTEYRAASLAVRLGQAPADGAPAKPKPKPKPKPVPALPIDPVTGKPIAPVPQ